MVKAKILLICLMAGALFSFQSPYDSATTGKTVAQIVDSTTRTDSVIRVAVETTAQTVAPTDTTVGPFKLPTWLLSLIAAITAAQPLIQFILKRIPTATSIKIGGWYGTILDALTFFQPDKSTQVRPTAPPPVQNGVEKPSISDLQNHK